jgi:hypothetical protein
MKKRKLTACAVSALLLALTVLSNFFNAMTAVVFILALVANDLFHLLRAANAERRRSETNALLSHLLSPAIALLLTLFWTVPMITEYKYFVTRPFAPQTQTLFSPWLLGWFAMAVFGGRRLVAPRTRRSPRRRFVGSRNPSPASKVRRESQHGEAGK